MGISLGDIAQVIASVETIKDQAKWLLGHPIIAIDDASDISQFDTVTGIGSGNWVGWGICNGNSYPGATGNIQTPNMIDRFMVGAQGSYAVGDTGGANEVTLTETMIPSHNHVMTDPGHTHILNDPGHTHALSDPGHSHSGVAVAHQHTFTTNIAGEHTHTYFWQPSVNEIQNGSGGSSQDSPPVGQNDATSSAGGHFHSGTTDSATPAINISNSVTGATIASASTGATNAAASSGITLANTGGGLPHENRPPYYALIFVKKIF